MSYSFLEKPLETHPDMCLTNLLSIFSFQSSWQTRLTTKVIYFLLSQYQFHFTFSLWANLTKTLGSTCIIVIWLEKVTWQDLGQWSESSALSALRERNVVFSQTRIRKDGAWMRKKMESLGTPLKPTVAYTNSIFPKMERQQLDRIVY